MKAIRSERGAAAVEMALVFSILIITIMALAEFGLLFKDWLTVGHAGGEAARIAAAAADDPKADIATLRGIEANMTALDISNLSRVEIINPGTGQTNTYTFTPATTCDWTPCPDPDDILYTPPLWLPSSRDVEAPVTDHIEVRLVYTHNWVTNFFASTTSLDRGVIRRIEPQVFAP